MPDGKSALRYMHSRMPVVARSNLKSSNMIGEELTMCPSGTDAIDMVCCAREAMGLRPARPQTQSAALTPTPPKQDAHATERSFDNGCDELRI